MDQKWKVKRNARSSKTTSGAFLLTVCDVWCFCICFLEFPGCFGHSLGLGALARKLVHFANLRAFSGIWGQFLAVLAFLCLFVQRNQNERRANIEQRRATSSNVEQRRANVEQTSSNVEQPRANVEQTSSNVEQRREMPKKQKNPQNARKCT